MKRKKIKLKIPLASQDQWLLFASILLLLLSFVYFVKGFYNLVLENYNLFPAGQNSAQDLFSRWQEQQYIYQGHYPYYIREDSPHVDPEIGPVKSGGYLPWSFFTGFILIPGLSWQSTRYYFGLLNLISLGILALFSYQIGAGYSKRKGLFSMASTFAISAHVTTLNNGQYGIIINAFLIGMYWLVKKRHALWSGLLLAIAFIKPNISGFYFFILTVKSKQYALLSFSAYIILGSTVIWRITGVNPIEMMHQILIQAKFFANQGASATNILIEFGVDPQLSIIIFGLIGILLTITIFSVWSQGSLLLLFATASVLGRVTTYHWFYDNVMLIFLVLVLLESAFKNNRKLDWFIFILVAFTLWIPRSLVDWMDPVEIFEFIQCLIWLMALVWILVNEKVTLAKP